jgi:two-component system NtrC family sensor kinase
VSADDAEVQQIILNLISNSIHSIQEVASSGNIHIAAEHAEGKVRLKITDSGAPISEEIESKLFDPFFTTKQQTKGTGLGLSISHGLMQGFGGDLRFQRNRVGEKEFVLEFETP